jgi:hypothetical protein
MMKLIAECGVTKVRNIQDFGTVYIPPEIFLQVQRKSYSRIAYLLHLTFGH